MRRYRKKNVKQSIKKATRLIKLEIDWVEKQILAEKAVFVNTLKRPEFEQTKLKWTAKKTDLIELLYALDASGCFNLGKVSLNMIAGYFEKVFDTDLSHFPRDFYEMRIRLDRMPFIDKLKNLLKKRMDDPKKPFIKG